MLQYLFIFALLLALCHGSSSSSSSSSWDDDSDDSDSSSEWTSYDQYHHVETEQKIWKSPTDGLILTNYEMHSSDSHGHDAGKVVGVVIVPDNRGVTDYAEWRARKFVAESEHNGAPVVAIVCDIFGLRDVVAERRRDFTRMYRGEEGWPLMESRISDCIDHLKEDHPEVEKIVLVGYCFGAGGVLDYARTGAGNGGRVDAVIGLHGMGRQPTSADGVEPQVIVFSGGDDDEAKEIDEMEQELNGAEALWAYTRYGHVLHAFTVPTDDRYSAFADHRSWAQTEQVIAEVGAEMQVGEVHALSADEIADWKLQKVYLNVTDPTDGEWLSPFVIFPHDFHLQHAPGMAADGADASEYSDSDSEDSDATEYNKEYHVVVIAPDWTGLDDYEEERAYLLAKEGYVVVGADIFGGGRRTVAEFSERVALVTKFRQNPELAYSRLAAALHVANQLQGGRHQHITSVSMFGYCFGGSLVLSFLMGAPASEAHFVRQALHHDALPVHAIVSFHGGLSGRVRFAEGGATLHDTAVLVESGGDDDAHSDLADLEAELNMAGYQWELSRYSDVRHGFTDFDGQAYNARAATRSWINALATLKQ